MAAFLGLDPGGADAFGWCLLSGDRFPLTVLSRGVVNNAAEAVAAGLDGGWQLAAAGIDAPLFWQASGDRRVDELVRAAVVRQGGHNATVNHVNSMRGACLVQGMMAAMFLRAHDAGLVITESHPKALLWLLGIARRGNPPGAIALAHLEQWVVGNAAGAGDHERDAALGALSAFVASTRMNGWQDLYPQETDPITPLAPPPGYWLPL